MDRWSDNKVPQLGYTILIVPADGIMYFDMGAYFKCRNKERIKRKKERKKERYRSILYI